ncbi:MAG: hypothetical protein ABIG73_01815 [Patescibacteria group bacterium]
MVKPYPKWKNKLVISVIILLLVISFFLGMIFSQFEDILLNVIYFLERLC